MEHKPTKEATLNKWEELNILNNKNSNGTYIILKLLIALYLDF